MTTIGPVAAGNIGLPIGKQPRDLALTTISTAIGDIDNARQSLARIYAMADGGTSVEHEVGECITVVRKALRQLRESLGTLAQVELPGMAN